MRRPGTLLAPMLGAVMLLAALSGCALVRPQVDVPLPEADASVTRDKAEKTFADAHKWVASVKRDIGSSRDIHQMSRWGFFGTALAMVASMAGLAATGTIGAPVVALSLGSAALATAGTTLPVDERVGVYNTALEAISCLELVVSPFDFTQSEEDLLFGKVPGVTDSDSLTTLRGKVAGEIGKFKTAPALNAEQTDALQALQEVLPKVDAQIPKAMAAYAGRTAAPRLLVGQTDQVVTKMNRALSDREPNLRSILFSLIPNPGQLLKAGALAPAPPAAALAPPLAVPHVRTGPDAVAAQQLVARARSAIDASNAILSKLSPDAGSAAKRCLDQAQTQFAHRPLAVQVLGSTELHPGGDGTTLSIREGTPPYTADLLGSAAANLAKAESDVADGRDVRITAVRNAKAGDYSVLVRDSSTPPQTVPQTFVVSVGPPPLAATLLAGTEPAGPKAELFYRVAGGTPPYTLTVLDGAPLQVALIGTDTIRVTVTAPVTAAETGFRVKDKAGASAVVTVKVTK